MDTYGAIWLWPCLVMAMYSYGLYSYRADWEPAATSGKCMAGVPGVFWRSPAVLQGPSTHNPTLVLRKTHTLKNWPIYGRYGHIPGTGGQIHTCSPGRLQGHLWVILTIGSCFYGSFWLFSVLGSGLLPHTRSKTLKTTVFLTQNATFWPMKGKNIKKIVIFYKSAIFCPMMRVIAEWHVFIPNEAFLVAKSALGPRGAKPPHIHMTQEKSANFSK